MDLLTWVVVPPATGLSWPPDHPPHINIWVQPHQLLTKYHVSMLTLPHLTIYWYLLFLFFFYNIFITVLVCAVTNYLAKLGFI